MTSYERAKRFVYRNARPLEIARWMNRFEDGERSAVLEALAAYQNEDGGFGHALEADNWNPASTPVATQTAAEILHEVSLTDPWHPLVRGILGYLDSGADFDAAHEQWRFAVPGNDRHPHAAWWSSTSEEAWNYNPTAALAGFAVRFADPDSALYDKACRIARQAFAWLQAHAPVNDMHVTKSFMSMLAYLEDAESAPVDLDALEQLIKKQVDACICRDESRWFTEYTARPSAFITSRLSPYYRLCPALCEREADLLSDRQMQDGGWPVTWRWSTPYLAEEAISLNWWRAAVTLENMKFLQAMGKE